MRNRVVITGSGVLSAIGQNPDEFWKNCLEAKFMDELKAESLDIITLLMEFEEAFDKTIPDEDAEKLVSVQDAVNYVMSLQERAPQA